jgi:hypothetical protein
MDGVGHVAGLDAARCTGPSGSTEVTATPAGLRLRDERSFGLRQAQAVSNISRDLLDGMSWTPRYPRLEDSFCGL